MVRAKSPIKPDTSPLKKHIQESPELQKLRRKREQAYKRMVVLVSILAVTVVAGLVTLVRYPKVQIRTINVTGNYVVQTNEVLTRVQGLLEGNYLYFIPRTNALFYPRQQIINDLLKTFPRFRSVDISQGDVTSLTITVNEVHGFALWCGMDSFRSDAPCYFADDLGRIIDTAPNYSGNVYPRFFGSMLIDDGANPLGKQIVEPERFTGLVTFAKEVTSLGLPVRATLVSANNNDSFIIDLGQNTFATIKFLADADYAVISKNLQLALAKDDLAKQIAKDKKNLQYFDLRFSNKVYYKFSDQ